MLEYYKCTHCIPLTPKTFRAGSMTHVHGMVKPYFVYLFLTRIMCVVFYDDDAGNDDEIQHYNKLVKACAFISNRRKINVKDNQQLCSKEKNVLMTYLPKDLEAIMLASLTYGRSCRPKGVHGDLPDVA